MAQRLKLNDIGQSNGEQQLWINGESIMNLSQLQIRVNGDTKIYGIMAQTFFVSALSPRVLRLSSAPTSILSGYTKADNYGAPDDETPSRTGRRPLLHFLIYPSLSPPQKPLLTSAGRPRRFMGFPKRSISLVQRLVARRLELSAGFSGSY